jgi:small subunit ribosomal protein S20
MPIKKSAKKYMRVTAKKTEKNKKAKGLFRSTIKKTRESVQNGKVEDAKEWLKKSIKALDKAAEKNIIHKNTAARKKSRLNKFVKAAIAKK